MESVDKKILLPSSEKDELDKLVCDVYSELKRLAAYHLHGERPNHTLRPTELVHEVYFILRNQHSLDLEDRSCFLSIASQIMRRVLVNYAIQRKRLKRGGDKEKIPFGLLDELTLIDFEKNQTDVLALEEALLTLKKRDPRQVRIVELYFYGGLTFQEIAEFLNISLRTVMREWKFARTWLFRQLHGEGV